MAVRCISLLTKPVGLGCSGFESLDVGEAAGLVDSVEQLQGEHQEPLVGQAQGLVDLASVLVEPVGGVADVRVPPVLQRASQDCDNI